MVDHAVFMLNLSTERRESQPRVAAFRPYFCVGGQSMLRPQQLDTDEFFLTTFAAHTKGDAMADKTLRGRFVWHELMTPDSVAAYGFYGKTLGWKTVNHEDEAGHTSLAGPGGPIANVTQQDEGAPSWIPYIGTDDLDQAISDASERGATVTKSITTLPGGGRYAVLSDPQGAAFGIYASDDPAPHDAPAKRGEHSWHELATSDAGAAIEFYIDLFGWEKMAEHDMGPLGAYYLLGRDGRQLIGIFKMMEGQPGPAWCGYIRVKDVEKTVKKVTSAGGKLINGPMEVPGGDRIAQFLDPQGAMFAIHALASDLQPPAPPPAAEEAEAEIEVEVEVEVETEAEVAAEEDEAAPAIEAAPTPAKPKKKRVAKKPAAKKPVTKKAPAKKARTKAAAKSKVPARKVAKVAKAGKKKASVKKSVKQAAKQAAKKAKAKAPQKIAKKKGARRKAK